MRTIIIYLATAALVSLLFAALRLMRYAHEAKQPRACTSCPIFKDALCTQSGAEKTPTHSIVA